MGLFRWRPRSGLGQNAPMSRGERAEQFEGETEQELRRRLAQLQALYRLTAVVSHSRQATDIFDEALRCLRDTLGAERSSILLFDEAGVARFRAWCGLSDAYRRAVDGHSPWRPEESDASPILVADVREDASVREYRETFEAEGVRALGFFPLKYGGGVLGKFMVYYGEPHHFSEAEVDVAQNIAQHLALAAGRLQAEDEQRRAAVVLETRRFLAETGEILSRSLDLDETFDHLARAVVPRIADHVIVYLVARDGSLERAAEASDVPEKEQILRELRRFPIERATPPWRAIESKTTQVLENLDPAALCGTGGDPEWLALIQRLGVRSALTVPLLARGEALGVISCGMSHSGRVISEETIALAEAVAERAAMALLNAQLYEAEQEARRTAEEAVLAREHLLAVVSHDLRTPLSAMTVASSLLERSIGGVGADGVRAVSTIRRSADAMERLIEDLLDLARLNSGTLAISVAEHDADELVRESLQLVQPLAERKQLRLTIEGSCGGAIVTCDRHRIFQVMNNLLGNAIKFTPQGGSVAVQLGRNGGDAVEVRITDTGPGISESELASVFHRYWQSKHGSRDGVGLGLTIAKGIVEAHGGTIRAESAGAVGSTFAFTLPLQPPVPLRR